jgi:DNA-binding beta-propeller fold protein YncE/mono/diheme cytochrome c family protein
MNGTIRLTILFLLCSKVALADVALKPCDILVDRAGNNLYILESGAKAICRAAADGSSPIVTADLSITPVRMSWIPGEKSLAVVGDVPDGKLLLVRVKDEDGSDRTPTVEKIFDAGHSPSDVAAFLRDGRLVLYVADRFGGVVREIDGVTGDMLRVFDAGREPVAVKITPDGGTLVVGNFLPEQPADVAYTTSRIRVIDLTTGEVVPVDLENGISNLYDLALSPDGRVAVAVATRGNYRTVTSQVEGGWIVDNVIVVVDVQRRKYVETFELDNKFRGAPNPRAVRFDDEGKKIVIALSGSGEIVLVSVPRLYEKINYRLSADIRKNPEPDERFLPFKTRVALGLSGIRSVAVHGDTVWGAAYFDDAVGRVRLSVTPSLLTGTDADSGYPPMPRIISPEEDTVPNPDGSLRWIAFDRYEPCEAIAFDRAFARLAPPPEETLIRRGEKLFNDALICREHWQSCITCHPDARADALSWDLVNDGVDNSKNTKNLLYSHATPPAMITGVRPDAETAVRAGVIHILFGKLPEEDYVAMDGYLKSLGPIPSPRLVDGKLSRSAERGKLLFESSRTGCADCHNGPYFTDMMMHPSVPQDPGEPRSKFDTPTLCEIWRTAPYLSTGHQTTLHGTLSEGKHANQDGRLDRLTSEELDDLIEYVLSL